MPRDLHKSPSREMKPAPVLRPTMEEFSDSFGYLLNHSSLIREAGMCRIVPPDNWKPPSGLDFHGPSFMSKVQHLSRLTHGDKRRQLFTRNLEQFWSTRGGIDVDRLDWVDLWDRVEALGGYDNVETWIDESKEMYMKFLLPFKLEYRTSQQRLKRRASPGEVVDVYCAGCKGSQWTNEFTVCDICGDYWHSFCIPVKALAGNWRCVECRDTYCYDDGDMYTLKEFQELAEQLSASINIGDGTLEEEYWSIVSKGTKDISVEYGSDIETTKFGSGFTDDNTSSWNINYFPKNPASVLRTLGNDNISGITQPWLYVGMIFSTFAWHVEDHLLYSVNYHHFGAPKRWYAVSGPQARHFEEIMALEYPELFSTDPDILFALVTMISPKKLRSHGIEVVTTLQGPRDFIVTSPQAYHGGFNHGFNCAEAVNFALQDWIPHGTLCTEIYRRFRKAPAFDFDQLLLTLARKTRLDESFQCWLGPSVSYLIRAEQFGRRRAFLSGVTRWKRLKLFDKSCVVCKHILSSSFVTCECSAKQVGCLEHFHLLCECGPSSKTAHYSQSIAELEVLYNQLLLRTKKHKNLQSIVSTANSILKALHEPYLKPALSMDGVLDDARKTLLEYQNSVDSEVQKTLQKRLQAVLWMNDTVDFIRRGLSK